MKIDRTTLERLCCYGVSCDDCPLFSAGYIPDDEDGDYDVQHSCNVGDFSTEQLREIWEARPVYKRLEVFRILYRGTPEIFADAMYDIIKLR